MKKTLLTFLTLSLFSVGANAQTTQSEEVTKKPVEARAVQKGNVIIDGYYAFPNLYKTIFRGMVQLAKDDNPNFSGSAIGIGPFGGTVQYLVDNNIGISLERNYMNFGFSWNDRGVRNSYITENYSIRFNLIRALVGAEFHAKSGEKLDLFGGARIGLSYTSVNFSSTDPAAKLSDLTFGNYRSGVGFASRFYGGVRFFPVKSLGLFIEGGVFGGGILRGGVSFKI